MKRSKRCYGVRSGFKWIKPIQENTSLSVKSSLKDSNTSVSGVAEFESWKYGDTFSEFESWKYGDTFFEKS